MGEIGPSSELWSSGCIYTAAETNKKGPQCQELAFYMTNKSVITR